MCIRQPGARAFNALALALTGVLALALGLRGWAFAVAVLLGHLPVGYATRRAAARLVWPRTEACAERLDFPRCPNCRSVLDFRGRGSKPFSCPGCHQPLRLRRLGHPKSAFALGVVLAVAVSLWSGLRGTALLAGVMLGSILAWVVAPGLRSLFAFPRAEPYIGDDRDPRFNTPLQL